MATDVDVQYFSHLNGLTLGNNWGDLIRLLDKALVTGIDFTQITAASIDAQGDVHITLYAAHDAMLFQVVELSGFAPTPFNQKYRIKGVPSATELILKPHTAIIETNITTVGAGKLASLGYEIIFRDTNDVKRVYRAKNPTAKHPFIRVDESLASADGTTGIYTSSYAKFAMVGLLEHMEHIDDYGDTNVHQLPFSSSAPTQNWDIAGIGNAVVRGWAKWYWATAQDLGSVLNDTSPPANVANKEFTLVGSRNVFYLSMADSTTQRMKYLRGCGLYETDFDSATPPWFLMATVNRSAANAIYRRYEMDGGLPLARNENSSKLFGINQAANSLVQIIPITPDYQSGVSNKFGATVVAAVQYPIYDASGYLLGNLPHVFYNGKATINHTGTKTVVAENSMYVYDANYASIDANTGSILYYIGELE